MDIKETGKEVALQVFAGLPHHFQVIVIIVAVIGGLVVGYFYLRWQNKGAEPQKDYLTIIKSLEDHVEWYKKEQLIFLETISELRKEKNAFVELIAELRAEKAALQLEIASLKNFMEAMKNA